MPFETSSPLATTACPLAVERSAGDWVPEVVSVAPFRFTVPLALATMAGALDFVVTTSVLFRMASEPSP